MFGHLLRTIIAAALAITLLGVAGDPARAANTDRRAGGDQDGTPSATTGKLIPPPKPPRVVKLTSVRRKAINREHRRANEHLVPRCAKYYVMWRDGSADPAGNKCESAADAPSAAWDFPWPDIDWPDEEFWGATWKYTKCAAAITLAVVPLAKAYTFVKALGGVRKTAELIVKAGSWKDLKDVAPGLAAEILGIAGIENNCF